MVAMAGAAWGRGTGSGAALEIACAEAGAWPVRSEGGRARSAAGLPASDESDEGRAEPGTTAATGGPATGALARRPARRAAVALPCAEAVGRAGLVGRGCRVKPVGTSGGSWGGPAARTGPSGPGRRWRASVRAARASWWRVKNIEGGRAAFGPTVLPARCGGVGRWVVWSAAGVGREVFKTPSSSAIVVQLEFGAVSASGLAGGGRLVVSKTLAECGGARASGGAAEGAPKAAAAGEVRPRLGFKTPSDLAGSREVAYTAGTEGAAGLTPIVSAADKRRGRVVSSILTRCGGSRTSGGGAEGATRAPATGGVWPRLVSKTLLALAGSREVADTAGTEGAAGVTPSGSADDERRGRIVSKTLTGPAGCWGGFSGRDGKERSGGKTRPV